MTLSSRLSFATPTILSFASRLVSSPRVSLPTSTEHAPAICPPKAPLSTNRADVQPHATHPTHHHVNSTITSKTTSPTSSPPLDLAPPSSLALCLVCILTHRDQPSPEALSQLRLYLCRRHRRHPGGAAMLPSTIPLSPLHLGPPLRGETTMTVKVKPTLNLDPGVLGDRPPTLLPKPTLNKKKTVPTSSTICRPLLPSRGEQQ